MATLFPPPKRQKVYHGVPEPEKEMPLPSPNVVVQFVSEEDGKPLAPSVNLPANISRSALEALVNKLNTQVGLFVFPNKLLTTMTAVCSIRMTIQYHLHSISLFLQTLRLRVHQRELQYQSP